MEILSNSTITGSGNYFINKDNFDYNLFFTDTNQTIYYTIVKYDYITYDNIIITEGKLNGYFNNTNYNYRFNFERFVNINNQIDLESDFYQWTDEGIYMKRIKENISNLTIYFSTTPILENNPSSYTTNENGVKLQIKYFITNLANYNTIFYDKYTDLLNNYPKNTFYYANNWFTVGCYQPEMNNKTYVTFKDDNNQLIKTYTLWGTSEGNLRQFFIYIPYNAVKIEVYTQLLPNNVYEYQVFNTEKCINTLFYWDDGVLETLHCEGNKKPVETVTKNIINIGNKKLTTKIDIEKSLLVNTGFSLNENQLFNLFKSPYVYSFDNVYLDNPQRNYINYPYSVDKMSYAALSPDTTVTYNYTTPGYTLFKNWNWTDDYFRIFIDDLFPITRQDYYYISFDWMKTTPSYFVWDVMFNESLYVGEISGTSQGVFEHFGAYIYVDEHINEYGFVDLIPNQNYQTSIVIKNLQIGKGPVIYPYSPSLTDLDAKKPKPKMYLLNNTSFDSYVGKNIGERNIELSLTECKHYTQKTNIKLKFFD